MSARACEGASTTPVRTTEHLERCRRCGTSVRFDLVNDSFFGFKAGCRYYLAQRLVGRLVRWNHLPTGEPIRVMHATDGGLIELEGWSGEFAPHLFTAVADASR